MTNDFSFKRSTTLDAQTKDVLSKPDEPTSLPETPVNDREPQSSKIGFVPIHEQPILERPTEEKAFEDGTPAGYFGQTPLPEIPEQSTAFLEQPTQQIAIQASSEDKPVKAEESEMTVIM